jgi:hypothetical protein
LIGWGPWVDLDDFGGAQGNTGIEGELSLPTGKILEQDEGAADEKEGRDDPDEDAKTR